LKTVLGETDISVHLVEVSLKLSQFQAECLTGDNTQPNDGDQPVYRSGTTRTGLPVYWYHRIEDIPRGTDASNCYAITQTLVDGKLTS